MSAHVLSNVLTSWGNRIMIKQRLAVLHSFYCSLKDAIPLHIS